MNLFPRIIVLFVFSLSLALAPYIHSADAPPTPGPEHKKLGLLVGDWTYEGQYFDSPLGPQGPFQGKLNARYVLSDFFVEVKWEETNNSGKISGVEMHGYDSESKTYKTFMFISDGTQTVGTDTITEDTIIGMFTVTDSQGNKYSGRSTIKFPNDKQTFTGVWELSLDEGKTWQRWQEFSMKRAK